MTVDELETVGETVGNGIGSVVEALARGSVLVTLGLQCSVKPFVEGRRGFALHRWASNLKIVRFRWTAMILTARCCVGIGIVAARLVAILLPDDTESELLALKIERNDELGVVAFVSEELRLGA